MQPISVSHSAQHLSEASRSPPGSTAPSHHLVAQLHNTWLHVGDVHHRLSSPHLHFLTKLLFLSFATTFPTGIIIIQFANMPLCFYVNSCFSTCITDCLYWCFQSTTCVLHTAAQQLPNCVPGTHQDPWGIRTGPQQNVELWKVFKTSWCVE